MAASKKPNETESKADGKTCFVVMPIADHDSYEKGHFKRVYDHVIAPACKAAGYKPVRADDVVKSNHIVVDILKNLVNSEMVVCDISSRNPNVLYELGLRHAFNLPTVLIKDFKTTDIFDISSIRYTSYNEDLRIDNVEKSIKSITKAIIDTASNDDDVNSIVQLLGVTKATTPDKIELDQGQSVILAQLERLMQKVEDTQQIKHSRYSEIRDEQIVQIDQKSFFVNNEHVSLGDEFYFSDTHNYAGILTGVSRGSVILYNPRNESNLVVNTFEERFERLTTNPIPF
ncbi:hypothetical protein [Enterovibrio baiacu]|uniref:hypothetical protein n=1 Tax=Enterovibrio baiacu TaxID=2491023 RepID=UPI003D0F7EB7